MNRRMLLISLLLAVLGPTAEAAEDNPLLGTWKLKSFVREVLATGERYNQMGEQPDGYLSYSADGRMLAFFVSDNQPRPRADPTDEERIKLHKGMLADLSPKVHPAMGGILFSFEPVWLGDATGRGAEPSTQRSVSSCCIADAVSLA
jgi:Lipocalin-like domain